VNFIIFILPYEEVNKLLKLKKVVNKVDTKRRYRLDIALIPILFNYAGSKNIVIFNIIDENITPVKPSSGKIIKKLGLKKDK